ncbi:MAG: CPBP family intramembrane metalloprotease [Betaproteobacteria bacterium]|nr:CPBP family intramembrane metalloprotease [Betaproteobacteria bacterium]
MTSGTIALDRRPAFWVAYAVAALASLAVAWQLFPHAIPLVHLDITMTRDAAIARAEALAAERRLAPEGARTAIVFNHDESAQSYVELEGGGKDAFARLVAGGAFSPYWWDVRLFRLGSVDEVLIRLRPNGALDGFTRRVAEAYVRDAATMALPPEAALALARERAARDWEVDFGPYTLLDQAQQTRPTGRVDHKFVFERSDRIGDARIRLQLVVTGDELTQVRPFVHVPESFERRFAEMRSANKAIAGVASLSAGVLYGLIGCVLGALWLLRQHWLVWKPPLVAGLIVGGLVAATILANAPAAWFGFPTTQDATTFWLRQWGMALLVFVGGGLALGEVFMAAEGLTRRAFPDHPQLWRLWSREAGGTVEVLGRTAGGYLFVPLELAFIAVFYFATNRWLGWWQPSESLTDPNILSSLVPALTPIAISLQAGFMEECVFRAVPLALGALIGARYGRRGLGIAIAFVLQAVIFGAAHANYPGLPSYSRLVELLAPSLFWAAIFLRYGLLPTILLHAVFDLVLISIPLFLIDAPGAWVQRALVIAAGLLPAAVVLGWRARQAGWLALPATLRNGAWQPRVPAPVAPERAAVAGAIGTRAALLQRALPGVGAAGLVAWIAFTPFVADAPPLAIGRAEAEAAAAAEIAARGAALGPEWTRRSLPAVALDSPAQRQWHAFVWREAGPAQYRALVGDVLAPPVWEVRFARFDGDVAERAEEWRATVAGNGRVRSVVHRLPEGRAGAMLERDAAQALAADALQKRLGLSAAALAPRVAEQEKRPARRDWSFAWANPAVAVGGGGEARVQVVVAGDEVVLSGHSLFVPEAWQRADAEREGRRQNLKIAGFALVLLLAVAALVYAVMAWSRGSCDRRAFWWVAALTLAMSVVGAANNWPTVAMQLRTTEPIATQLTLTVLGTLAGGVVLALLVGLLAGVGAHYARAQVASRLAGRLPAWLAGVAAACATAGIAAALAALVPQTLPQWPDTKLVAGAWPWVGALTAGLAFVPALAVTLFLLAVVDRATVGWTRRIALAALVLVGIGVALAIVAGRDAGHALLQGGVEGLVALAMAWLVLRYDLRAVPAFVATGIVLEAGRTAALAGTATAWALVALATVVTVAFAWAATRCVAPARAPA